MKRILPIVLLFLLQLVPLTVAAETNQNIRDSVESHSTTADYEGINIDEIKNYANNIDGQKAYSKVKDLSIYVYVVLIIIGLLLLMFGKVKTFLLWLVLGAIAVIGTHNVEGFIGTILSLGESFFDFIISD